VSRALPRRLDMLPGVGTDSKALDADACPFS
jgi:hypothetical protein